MFGQEGVRDMEMQEERFVQYSWWHELNCRNVLAATSFYGRTLGWRFEEIPLPDGATYRIARQNGFAVCGICEIEAATGIDVPDHWMTYMATPDIAVALRAVSFAGGTVVREPRMVPGLGLLALVEDAGGAFMGLIEPHPAHPVHTADTQCRVQAETELRKAARPLEKFQLSGRTA